MRGDSIDIEISEMKGRYQLETDNIAGASTRDLMQSLTCTRSDFPVEIMTNSSEILESAKRSWGHYKSKFSLHL